MKEVIFVEQEKILISCSTSNNIYKPLFLIFLIEKR